jgi:hypothetical protein
MCLNFFKNVGVSQCWWLMPIILATQEAEIRGNSIQSQPGQIAPKILSQKNTSQTKEKKKKAGGVVQGVGLEFKPSTEKKKKVAVLQNWC